MENRFSDKREKLPRLDCGRAAQVGRGESDEDTLEFHRLILDDLDDEIGASFDDDEITSFQVYPEDDVQGTA